MVIPVLVARAALREQFKVLHALLLRLVRHDRACRLLMTAPGVGPVAAMTFRATVDVPARFRKSKAVGAHFGLTRASTNRARWIEPGASQNAAIAWCEPRSSKLRRP